jgi:hypothetical protein
MGVNIWLFIHIIDRADWETGVVYEWIDAHAAEEMGMDINTLRKQRQRLQESGYISCRQLQHGQEITIHNWVNPKNYSGKVLNRKSKGGSELLPSTSEGGNQGSNQGSNQVIVQFTTPSIKAHETMDHVFNGWMDADPICNFLMGLPGYNPTRLKADRDAIFSQGYDIEELEYLWRDCEDAVNPIDLFLYKVEKGMQSKEYLDLLDSRRIQIRVTRISEPVTTAADPSVLAPIPGLGLSPVAAWDMALGEMALDMSQTTFDVFVRPAVLLSANGAWKIGVCGEQEREWLERNLTRTVKRVLSGIVGNQVEVEFVTI